MRAWAPAVLLCAAVAACSSGGGTPGAQGGPSPAASSATTPQPAAKPTKAATPKPTAAATSAAPRPSATATPKTDVKDGHQVGYLKAINTGTRTLRVDIAQWLEGAAAEKAWQEDGNTEEMPFSFYIRNQSTKLRTLPFAANVRITVNTLAAEETGSSSTDTSVSVAKFAGYFTGDEIGYHPFHLTVRNGVITEIREQYLP